MDPLIIDFDFALYMINDKSRIGPTVHSTAIYEDPYLLLNISKYRLESKYSSSNDLWAFGIMMLEVLGGIGALYMPDNNDSDPAGSIANYYIDNFTDQKTRESIINKKLRSIQSTQIKSSAVDLLTKILDPNPDRRLPMQKILTHPFFQSMTIVEGGHYTTSLSVFQGPSDFLNYIIFLLKFTLIIEFLYYIWLLIFFIGACHYLFLNQMV